MSKILQEQQAKKVVKITHCLHSNCSGFYEDIFQSIIIQCQNPKHKQIQMCDLEQRQTEDTEVIEGRNNNGLNII